MERLRRLIFNIRSNARNQEGSTIDDRDLRGRTTLHHNVEYGDVKKVEKLVRRGYNINAEDYSFETPILLSVRQNNVKMTQLLVSRGADVDAHDREGKTPLIISVTLGNVRLLKFLISAGANINAADEDGLTALHESVIKVDEESLKILLRAGAKVDIKDSAGWTALQLSARRNHMKIVELLINSGASVDIKGHQGRTALHESSLRGYIDMVKLLLSRGAAVNIQDESLWTPLHDCAQAGDLKIAMLLLKHGASRGLRNENRDNPLTLAKRLQHKAIEILLQNADFLTNHTSFDEDSVIKVIQLLATQNPTETREHVPLNDSTLSRIAESYQGSEDRQTDIDEYSDIYIVYQTLDELATERQEATQESSETVPSNIPCINESTCSIPQPVGLQPRAIAEGTNQLPDEGHEDEDLWRYVYVDEDLLATQKYKEQTRSKAVNLEEYNGISDIPPPLPPRNLSRRSRAQSVHQTYEPTLTDYRNNDVLNDEMQHRSREPLSILHAGVVNIHVYDRPSRIADTNVYRQGVYNQLDPSSCTGSSGSSHIRGAPRESPGNPEVTNLSSEQRERTNYPSEGNRNSVLTSDQKRTASQDSFQPLLSSSTSTHNTSTHVGQHNRDPSLTEAGTRQQSRTSPRCTLNAEPAISDTANALDEETLVKVPVQPRRSVSVNALETETTDLVPGMRSSRDDLNRMVFGSLDELNGRACNITYNHYHNHYRVKKAQNWSLGGALSVHQAQHNDYENDDCTTGSSSSSGATDEGHQADVNR